MFSGTQLKCWLASQGGSDSLGQQFLGLQKCILQNDMENSHWAFKNASAFVRDNIMEATL